jgi:hypothetical protein
MACSSAKSVSSFWPQLAVRSINRHVSINPMGFFISDNPSSELQKYKKRRIKMINYEFFCIFIKLFFY